jgi:uncharacterized OB-fold protein
MSRDRRPLPRVDEESRGFWEALARHEFYLQRCAGCAQLRYPPRAVCPSCLSSEVDWVEMSGRGTVYSFTVTHQNHAPGFRERLPYVLAIIELEEGVRLMANVTGCEPGDVRIGMPVFVEYEDVSDDITLPVFRPRT